METAICILCKKELQGTWNMNMTTGFFAKRSGRNLGVNDAYFLSPFKPGAVNCYCNFCWEQQILDLPFVKQHQNSLKNHNNNLQEKINSLSQQLSNIQQQLVLSNQQLNESQLKLNSINSTVAKIISYEEESKLKELKEIVNELSEEEMKAFQTCGFDPHNISLSLDEQLKKTFISFSTNTWDTIMCNISSITSNLQNTKEKVEKVIIATENQLTEIAIGIDMVSVTVAPLHLVVEKMTGNIEKWKKLKEKFEKISKNDITPSTITDDKPTIELNLTE